MEKRFPCVAGTFYPAEKEKLKNIIEGFLNEISLPQIKGKIFGILSPHAGYIYSGKVAAYSFKSIALRKIERVILIGVSHQKIFKGISLWKKGSWITPLGEVLLDIKFLEEISKKFKDIGEEPHLFEHSLEVQLPFLQVVLKENFKIVPILLGSNNLDLIKTLAGFLAKEIFKKETLIVASSDLSHYPPDEVARKVDKEVLKAILTKEINVLEKTILELESKFPEVDTFLCGKSAVEILMEVAKNIKNSYGEILCYQNSSDVSFDKSQVVGYGSLYFSKI